VQGSEYSAMESKPSCGFGHLPQFRVILSLLVITEQNTDKVISKLYCAIAA